MLELAEILALSICLSYSQSNASLQFASTINLARRCKWWIISI